MTPGSEQSVPPQPPTLIIVVDGRLYVVEAADAPITIGRESTAQVVIDHPGISTKHLRIAPADDGTWQATDQSTNGSFLDGVRQREFSVVDGLAIHLGSAEDGIAVSFSLRMPQPGDAEAVPTAEPHPEPDPGTTALIATHDPDEQVVNTTAAIDPPILTQAVDVALATISTTMGSVTAAGFQEWSRRTLPELRRLEALSANAAQSAAGAPELMMTLSRIRRMYRQVMLRAAAEPGATSGQKLFQARHEAQITVDEAANAIQVAPATILAAESDESLAPDDAAAIRRLHAWLTHL
ncbi:FHA domain-containing protein [Mycobacterium sp. NPDC003449]